MPVRVGLALDNRYVRMLIPMRGERSGMEAGQDHREEAEEGDELAHAVPVSAVHALWIAYVNALIEFAPRKHPRVCLRASAC